MAAEHDLLSDALDELERAIRTVSDRATVVMGNRSLSATHAQRACNRLRGALRQVYHIEETLEVFARGVSL